MRRFIVKNHFETAIMKNVFLVKNVWLVSFLLACLTIIIFGNTLKNGFVYDDSAYVVNNYHIRNFSYFPSYFTSLQTYQSTAAEGQFKVYRPLVTATFAIDYAIWGLNPMGYHLTNILLHWLVSVVVYIFFAMLFANPLVAMISAVFFLIHPVQVEAVSWISGRGNMLYALFTLLTLIEWIRYLRCTRMKYIFTAFLCYTIALFSKETAFSTIPLMILIAVFLSHVTSRKHILTVLIPFAVISTFYLLLRATVIGGISQRTIWGGSYNSTIATMTKVILMYWSKLLIPIKLNVLPQVTIIRSLLSPISIAYCAIVIVIFYFIGINRNTPRMIRFASWWIMLALLPVSNIIPLRALFAERFLYLSVAGFGCILACIASRSSYRKTAFILLFILAILFTSKTISYNTKWYSNERLWRTVLTVDSNNPKAHNGMAMEYLSNNNLSAAEQELNIALQYDSSNPYITNNLALVSLQLGNNDKALKLFKQTIQLDKNQALAYHNLGLLYAEKENYQQALPYLEKALELDNTYANAYNSLAMCCFRLGQHQRAVDLWETAIKLQPDNPQPFYNIIISYLQRNDIDNAKKYYSLALQSFPNNASLRKLSSKLH